MEYQGLLYLYGHMRQADGRLDGEAGIFQLWQLGEGRYCYKHQKDLSVASATAQKAYFASQMNVKLRQVEISLDGTKSVKTQAGAMQMMLGNVEMATGVTGAKGFLGAMVKAAVTNETAVKPEYSGNGQVILEPTYKHILLQDVADWGPGGLVIEDGMFLASEGSVAHKVVENTQSLG